MKTVGEILRETRVKKGMRLEDAAASIKVKPEYLIALEASDYQRLGAAPYIKGLIRAYGLYLGLEPVEILAFFRREFDEAKVKLKKIPPQPLNRSPLIIAPASLILSLTGILIGLFLLFLTWQYLRFANAPVLLISSPSEGQISDRPFVNVIGRTDPDVRLSINGEEALVSEKGTFEKTITLNSGLNTLRISAINKLKKETVVTRTVGVKTGD